MLIWTRTRTRTRTRARTRTRTRTRTRYKNENGEFKYPGEAVASWSSASEAPKMKATSTVRN
jgi:hypothetical protein